MSARRSPAARALDAALDFTVAPGYSRLGYGLRRLRWHDAVLPGLGGSTALVTGASSGIGEATCEGLVAAGAEVHMLGRDRERMEQARARVAEPVGAGAERLRIELCDISSLAEVRRFATAFLAERDSIDLLVHNAGVLLGERRRTAEGVELTFATNVLGPYLLTRLLLPGLRRADRARVITVSSGGMYAARLDAGDPQLERRGFDGVRFYAHTKRAEVVLNRLWAERENGGRVGFCAMHPGWANTPGLASSLPRFHRLMRPALRDAHQAADKVVWLATSPALEPASGGFWHERAPRPEHRVAWTRESAADRARLWAYCEHLAAGGESDTGL
jgi:NAD(P)-dependent dehydrogenase (short-subunit alcohol dehydrogenase family)